MESGYLSREAVKDLLAVREGEIIFLKRRVTELETENRVLSEQLKNEQSK